MPVHRDKSKMLVVNAKIVPISNNHHKTGPSVLFLHVMQVKFFTLLVFAEIVRTVKFQELIKDHV